MSNLTTLSVLAWPAVVALTMRYIAALAGLVATLRRAHVADRPEIFMAYAAVLRPSSRPVGAGTGRRPHAPRRKGAARRRQAPP